MMVLLFFQNTEKVYAETVQCNRFTFQ